MRILIVSHEYPPIGGGGANACMNLAKEYARAGHESVIVTAGFGQLPLREEDDKITLIRVPAKRKHKEHCSFQEMFSYIMKAWPVINRLAAEEHFDVCQVFFGIPSGVLGYGLKRKYQLPYVIRFGGGDIPGFQDRFAFVYKVIAPFIKEIWKKADALVANSKGLKDMALDFYNKKEIGIICNGVDSKKFCPSENKKQNTAINILFVSRLIERKGLQFVLPKLWEIRTQSGRDIVLTIVGDGPYRQELEQIAEATQCKDLVRFEGQKEKEELPAYYQEADFFILPSAKEGMPNVVLEAMASGLPIIMTPCQGSDELVDGNGSVVPIEQFAQAMLEMIQRDEMRRSYGAESVRLVKERFSWKAVAEEYIKVFEKGTKGEA